MSEKNDKIAAMWAKVQELPAASKLRVAAAIIEAGHVAIALPVVEIALVELRKESADA